MPEQFTAAEQELLTVLDSKLEPDATCDLCQSAASWACPCPNPDCTTTPGLLCQGHYQYQLLSFQAAFRNTSDGAHYHCSACRYVISSPEVAMARWVKIAC